MNETDWQAHVSKFVRLLQIIVAALVAGCLIFVVVVLVVRELGAGHGGDRGQLGPVSWMALGLLAMLLGARAVVPTLVVNKGRAKIAQDAFPLPPARDESQPDAAESLDQMGDAGRLLMLFQIKTIVGAALVEGAALVMLLSFLIEGHLAALGIAIALILVIAVQMPTRLGVVYWIEDQLRILQEERSLVDRRT